MAAKRMSKTELIEAIANQAGLEKKQVNAVLDALNDVV
jgi:nucleoid DNA-binding protein